MPSALAVLRLMISSTFVACCVGRSAGFSPLMLLPTERFAVSMDWGTFQGTNAVALNAALRLGTNVQANGGLAYGAQMAAERAVAPGCA